MTKPTLILVGRGNPKWVAKITVVTGMCSVMIECKTNTHSMGVTSVKPYRHNSVLFIYGVGFRIWNAFKSLYDG